MVDLVGYGEYLLLLDTMRTALLIIQALSAVLLIISILLQNRGSGLSSTFGGDSNVYRTKRGIEKGLLVATVVFAFLFLGASLAAIVVPR